MLKLDEDMSEALKKMKRVQEIGKCLPDVDCGACGSPNCQSFAEDIVQGYAKINQCVFVQRIFEKKGDSFSRRIFQHYEGYGVAINLIKIVA
jgi:uncharacterized Fe-S cluster-containing protein